MGQAGRAQLLDDGYHKLKQAMSDHTSKHNTGPRPYRAARPPFQL